jgi:hypothetical protein
MIHKIASVFDPMWAGIPQPRQDFRLMDCGVLLPTQYYADQPYLARTHDGGILCVVTTGCGHEGSRGQHVLAMKTFDEGQTWQDVTPVEDPDGPESSWGIPFTAPGGRVFVFYVHNTDDLRELPADEPPYPGGVTQRMDSHGHYVFRWSDDHGKTWSPERVEIPVREFAIDRANATAGKIRLFWNVGKAFAYGDKLMLPLHKVGGFGEGWFTSSEGALVCSPNLLVVDDPRQANWETLPAGDFGIRTPPGGGPVAEEHSFVTLSDGGIFTVFRTIDGYSACAYSRDGGVSWGSSEYMRFASGCRMKNPRAANFVWKLPDGGYLYCFHNHGGKVLQDHPKRRTISYTGRNPMWFCRGWEVEGPNGKEIHWSEPEIGLYHDDPLVRMSYPDCMPLDNGEILFTETQKAQARIHRLSPELADAMSADPAIRLRRLDELLPIASWKRSNDNSQMPFPALPALAVRSTETPYGARRTREGFAIDLTLTVNDSGPGLVAAFEEAGAGLWLEWTAEQTLRLRMCDGENEVSWMSSLFAVRKDPYRITINVDGGSGTICFFCDGIFDDGGDLRDYGWGRLSPWFRGVLSDYPQGSLADLSLKATCNSQTSGMLQFLDGAGALIESIQFYGRILLAAEVTVLCQEAGIEESFKTDLHLHAAARS